MSYLPFILLLGVGLIPHNPDHTRHQLWIGAVASILIITLVIFKRFHWSGALLFFLSAASAAFCTFAPISPFSSFGVSVVTSFDSVSAQSLSYLLCVTVPFLLIRDSDLDQWIWGFSALGLINSVIIILNQMISPQPVGILDNPALDATFIAILYPSMIFRDFVFPRHIPTFAIKVWLFACLMLPLIAIMVTRSSTGLAVVAGEIILYLIMTFSKTVAQMGLVLIGTAITFAMGEFIIGHEALFNSSGRFPIWRMSLAYWLSLKQYWLGTGSGTYQILGPAVQKANGVTSLFVSAHNDWLQILFEQGIIGWILAGLTFCFMILGSGRSRGHWLLVTVMGIGASALTQMPLRIFPMTMFCALVYRLCFRRKDESVLECQGD